MKITWALMVLLSLSVYAAFAEESFTREEVDHAFGTASGQQYYPVVGVDTDELPQIAFTDESDLLHYYQLKPDTYFFYGNVAEVDENNRGFNGNAGFVVTGDGVVVIDALGSPRLGRRMIKTIASVTDQPIKYLIITHNHPDHAYGAVAFRELDGVKVIGHEGTMKYINSDRIGHSVAYRKTFIAEDMQGFKPVTPDLLVGGELYEKQSITVGDKQFDIYNTGSHHSYGDLIIHQQPDNVVWISDLAFNNRVTFMADGQSQAAIDAMTWLLNKFSGAALMIPGHGSAQTAPFPMVTRTRAYMQRLRNNMTAAIEEGVDLHEALQQSDFSEWKDERLYELNHGKNVDFVYREVELEAF